MKDSNVFKHMKRMHYQQAIFTREPIEPPVLNRSTYTRPFVIDISHTYGKTQVWDLKIPQDDHMWLLFVLASH